MRQPDACPFRNERPARLALLIRDLRARRGATQVRERERTRAGDETVHRQPPVTELVVEDPQIRARFRWWTVDRNHLRDIAPREFTSERQVAGDEPLCRVCQRFADAEKPMMIGRNEAVATGQVKRRTD